MDDPRSSPWGYHDAGGRRDRQRGELFTVGWRRSRWAIHRAAGAELAHACRLLGGCKTGDAKATPGFALPARWVIHTVGPVWRGGTHGEPELLASCYQRSLECAEEVGAWSVAFPAISTGRYGYPIEDAAYIAVQSIQAFEGSIDLVRLVAFDPDTFASYATLLR